MILLHRTSRQYKPKTNLFTLIVNTRVINYTSSLLIHNDFRTYRIISTIDNLRSVVTKKSRGVKRFFFCATDPE